MSKLILKTSKLYVSKTHGKAQTIAFRSLYNLHKPNDKYMTTKPRYELLDDMECVVATADRLQDLAYAQALDGLRRPLFLDTKLGRCVEAPEKESN